MIKKCIQCGNDYESIQKSGQEQKYCSKSCRNKSANERRESVLAEKLKREIHEQTDSRNERRENQEKSSTIYGSTFGLSTDKVFELVSQNAHLTAENKRLIDKVQALEIERGELLAEIDSYEENDDNNSNNMGSIGEMVKPYLPVIVPAIVSIFSPKENTQSKPTNNNAKQQATSRPG